MVLTLLLFHRGKGDYFRLGHGHDSHQRSPKRVMGYLAQKKVVDIACGSLHCLACTSDGKVYAWGDNDEGQIGNDTTTACQSPFVSARREGGREGGGGGGARGGREGGRKGGREFVMYL